MKRFFPVLVTLISSCVWADTVKLSSGGICHDKFSSHYERTKNFTEFDSIDSCLESGGRLPKGYIGEQQPSGNDYNRSKFGEGMSLDLISPDLVSLTTVTHLEHHAEGPTADTPPT